MLCFSRWMKTRLYVCTEERTSSGSAHLLEKFAKWRKPYTCRCRCSTSENGTRRRKCGAATRSSAMRGWAMFSQSETSTTTTSGSSGCASGGCGTRGRRSGWRWRTTWSCGRFSTSWGTIAPTRGGRCSAGATRGWPRPTARSSCRCSTTTPSGATGLITPTGSCRCWTRSWRGSTRSTTALGSSCRRSTARLPRGWFAPSVERLWTSLSSTAAATTEDYSVNCCEIICYMYVSLI